MSPWYGYCKVIIDYACIEVTKGFLVGYGLDYNEEYRYLPDVYQLIP